MARKVGVRELRQNLSVYLREVVAGESFEVTDHGRPVAVLAPLPERSTPLGRLIAAGKARVPIGHLSDLGPPVRSRIPISLSEALEDERGERL